MHNAIGVGVFAPSFVGTVRWVLEVVGWGGLPDDLDAWYGLMDYVPLNYIWLALAAGSAFWLISYNWHWLRNWYWRATERTMPDADLVRALEWISGASILRTHDASLRGHGLSTDALISAARRGRITLYGCPVGTHVFEKIAPRRWYRLSIRTESTPAGVLVNAVDQSGAVEYSSVSCKLDEVKAEWPYDHQRDRI